MKYKICISIVYILEYKTSLSLIMLPKIWIHIMVQLNSTSGVFINIFLIKSGHVLQSTKCGRWHSWYTLLVRCIMDEMVIRSSIYDAAVCFEASSVQAYILNVISVSHTMYYKLNHSLSFPDTGSKVYSTEQHVILFEKYAKILDLVTQQWHFWNCNHMRWLLCRDSIILRVMIGFIPATACLDPRTM
jgi:hypothetical protein